MRLTLLTTLAGALALCSTTLSAPTLEHRLPSGPDPAYSVPTDTLAAGLTCDSGSPDMVKNPILLVPGSGTTGPQSFNSSWIPLSRNLGYTPCWVSPPSFMLDDSQINAEHIVYAIKTLFAGSGDCKVPILTWSQGGLATQWALTFFPSIREQTSRLVAFAPDYQGTYEALLLDGFGMAAPSVVQQTSGSTYLTALKNAGGLNEIVPTTNVYSVFDDIVQPQTSGDASDSSYLKKAMNVRAQDTCGPLFLIDHASSLTSQFSYAVGRSALLSSTGRAKDTTFGKADCNSLPADQLDSDQKLSSSALLLVAGGNVAQGPKAKCEPDLQPYARKYAFGKSTCSGIIFS